MSGRQISDASIEKFKLGYDTATDRLTIPYLSPAGPWSIKFRCITDHDCKDAGHAKYYYPPGTAMHLFNASALLSADLVVVVEGEIDAISVDQVGLTAVGYPGTAMWKANPHWKWCFDSCTEIVVVADNDDQGRKAAAGVADSLRNAVSADVRVANLPGEEHEDANSFIHKFGETEFLERLDLL